jgi:hypothetical protein
MKMISQDKEEIFLYLESLNPKHLSGGLVTMMLQYFADNVEQGLATCLDGKFFNDLETLILILDVRQKYPFEEINDDTK